MSGRAKRLERAARKRMAKSLHFGQSYASLMKAEEDDKKGKKPEMAGKEPDEGQEGESRQGGGVNGGMDQGSLASAMARVVGEAHQRAMASMPAPSDVPPHANDFWGHLAAAGHHAHMMQLAHDLHGERDLPDQDRRASGAYPEANHAALAEAHRRIAQSHLDAAHSIGSEHPDSWRHMNSAPPEDRMLAGPVAGAMHPHGGMHPKDASASNGQPDHSAWIKDWSWSFHEPQEAAKVPLQDMAPRRIGAEHAAHAVLSNAEASADDFAGNGMAKPGSGHRMDARLPMLRRAAGKARGQA